MMKTLVMSKNKLTAIPEDLGKLSKLETLNLSFNFIQSIPTSFQQLKHLKYVWKFRHIATVPHPTQLTKSWVGLFF